MVLDLDSPTKEREVGVDDAPPMDEVKGHEAGDGSSHVNKLLLWNHEPETDVITQLSKI